MSRPLRKALLFLLALMVIGGLLYGLRGSIHYAGFSWARLGEAVRGARLDLLILSILAIYACYWIRALRWVRLSRHIGPAGVWSVYSATLMGFLAIVLFGRLGEPVRPLLIARRERLPISAQFGVYVVERVFDIAVTIFMTGWTLVYLPSLLREHEGTESWTHSTALLPVLRKAGFAFFAVLALSAVFLAYVGLTRGGFLGRAVVRWHHAEGWRKRVAKIFAGFLEGLQALRTWGDLAVAVGLTAAHWGLVLAIYVWVPHSFGGRLGTFTTREALVTLACTMLGSALQLPGIGGGSWAGSFLAMTVFLGIASEPAMAAAVTLWLITFAGCSLAGIPLLLREGMSLGDLRRIAAEYEKGPAVPAAPAPPRGSQP
ncbi:MAG TPA: lysylphosphatidylglycerol synthase transmembrane domain-containing protein [Candidatus Acidoferrales bacterium]|nr:lysylphosphatidylglycerol synthase transmembrane domain-containing protein [Candidatus Acidoferrales bacterium]